MAYWHSPQPINVCRLNSQFGADDGGYTRILIFNVNLKNAFKNVSTRVERRFVLNTATISN